VDANLDGDYRDVFEAQSDREGYDLFAIDLSGNEAWSAGYREGGEVMPLPRMFGIGNTYYGIEIAHDAAAIRITPVQPQFGQLDLNTSDAQVVLVSDSGLHVVQGGDGTYRLPAGYYSARDVNLRRKDEEGDVWLVEGTGTGKLGSFAIQPGQATVVQAGAPLVLSAEIGGRGNVLSLGFKIEGRAAEVYSPRATRDGRGVPAPRFRILTQQGKVLVSDSFEYG
jgi:hypothetical protein